MKPSLTSSMVLLAGIAIGAAAAAHASPAKPLPGYVIGQIEVTDPATYKTYADQVQGTLTPFGGHFLVRGGKTVAVEGDAPQRAVVIAFDSVEKAKAWEDSPAYAAIKGIRLRAARARIFIAEGVDAP